MANARQEPAPGTRLIRHCGDVLRVCLAADPDAPGRAALRTNLGSARVRRSEIIRRVEKDQPILGRDWHDIPMRAAGSGRYEVSVPLVEVGRFEAKAFFQPDGSAELAWPDGANIVVKVEPAETCRGNSVYTAFVRLFGRGGAASADASREPLLHDLDAAGYTVIPPSGTFRDLIRHLDFILGELRFRIIQLLPIHPTPTTYARMGRYGSPFASLDFRDVDPALAEFDRRTTPMEQFRELLDAVHARDARLFMDLPINHTGWASHLQIEHPEWFARRDDRAFQSPGAWGVTWEDLSKLDYGQRRLWEYMADVFLFWCRRQVDGFRCDAGYMIPAPVWEYIVAKVRDEYPDTVFLLEGLGGQAETAERLLADANLNWTYSELFQNYTPSQVAACLASDERSALTGGLPVTFAETHDNARLAAASPAHARMRTALAALCSHAGAFGITAGVEWLAREKIDVHRPSSLNWGAAENQTRDVALLNALLESHPAFRAGGRVRVLAEGPAGGLAALRSDGAGGHPLLVLANLGDREAAEIAWDRADFAGDAPLTDLVSGRQVTPRRDGPAFRLRVEPLTAMCLTPVAEDSDRLARALATPPGQTDADHQRLRAKAAEIVQAFAADAGSRDLDAEARALARDPVAFCAGAQGGGPAPVVAWQWPGDVRRRVVVPAGWCLCVRAGSRFAAELLHAGSTVRRERSLPAEGGGHFALFGPLFGGRRSAECALELTVYEAGECRRARAAVLYPAEPGAGDVRLSFPREDVLRGGLYGLCTDGLGGMAQARGAWGELRSKYDALLAANLHPAFPVDRHVMLTRCRAWLVCRKYSQAVSLDCLERFACREENGIEWRFSVPVGHGKRVALDVELRMIRGANEIAIRFLRRRRDGAEDALDDGEPVDLILRPDVEDRSCHAVTKAYAGPEQAWPRLVVAQADGFRFGASADRRLHVRLAPGAFVGEPQWTHGVFLPVEAERGLEAHTDLFSPGYFTAPLRGGESALLRAAARTGRERPRTAAPAASGHHAAAARVGMREAMRRAIRQFVVRRDASKTVVAGYPWFLDWGRDTLIGLRGIVAAGLLDDARAMLLEFAGRERGGTLPNMIRGDDDSNRDTSDAPLWFSVACADLMRAEGTDALLRADCGGRTVLDVLRSVGDGILRGTPNGIRADPASGLVFSPAHFTWMDTNHPAGTPREGYPVEIQALWHAALRLLAEADPSAGWGTLAERVHDSILSLYPRSDGEGGRYLSDCLHGAPGTPARAAEADDALRPNQLLAVTLGAVNDQALGAAIVRACEPLLVPGAIRSLADRPVCRALPVRHQDRLLNDPSRPYWGRYEGDEDTRRKPAYHNGTAWTWLFPSYAEALFIVHGEAARRPARSLLGAAAELVNGGCVGQVPEIVDGDAPHAQRGCGAQAWGATELYRVLALLDPRG